jgi:hypothetical protein
MSIEQRIKAIEDHLIELGKTDAHTGEQTLEFRLSVMEGGIQILESQHLECNNSDEGEFKAAHGFIVKDIMKRVDGIQKKLDRISLLLKDKEFTISGEDALRL